MCAKAFARSDACVVSLCIHAIGYCVNGSYNHLRMSYSTSSNERRWKSEATNGDGSAMEAQYVLDNPMRREDNPSTNFFSSASVTPCTLASDPRRAAPDIF